MFQVMSKIRIRLSIFFAIVNKYNGIEMQSKTLKSASKTSDIVNK